MTPKIEIGEIVQLKSGGPLMVISTIDHGRSEERDTMGKLTAPAKRPYAYCRWFDGAKLEQAPFPYETLACPTSPQVPKPKED